MHPIFPALALLADLATNVRYSGLYHYYYLDGADLVRASCGGQEVHNRSTCNTSPLRVPAATIFGTLQSGWETSTKYWENEAHQLEVVVLNIDDARLSMLSATPPPSADALKQQMTALNDTLVKKDQAVADLDNQIVIINQHLATADDVDQRLNLARVEGQRSQLAGERDKIAADLESIRDQYIAAAGAVISDTTFHDLWVERQERLDKLASARQEADKDLADLAALSKIFNLISNEGFAIDVTGGSASFVNEQTMFKFLEREFDKAHPDESRDEFRTYAGWVALSWAGKWTCDTALVGSDVKQFTFNVLHLNDVGNPPTGFTLEASTTIPFEDGAKTLDLHYTCEIEKAFSVQCLYYGDETAHPASLLAFDDDFGISSFNSTFDGKLIDGIANCSKAP